MSDGSRRTAVAWVVAAVLAGLVVLKVAGSDGDAGAGSPVKLERSPGGGGSSRVRGGAAEGGIYVHVAGAVRRPGLVQLSSGARIAEAVERAGGPTRRAELAGVNLAATLEDGQQVVVPARGAAAASASSGSATGVSATPGGSSEPGAAGAPKISLGVATPEQLDQIDGIGPTLAQRIIEYRTEHGGFRSIGELREVEGIGEKRFETLSGALQP